MGGWRWVEPGRSGRRGGTLFDSEADARRDAVLKGTQGKLDEALVAPFWRQMERGGWKIEWVK